MTTIKILALDVFAKLLLQSVRFHQWIAEKSLRQAESESFTDAYAKVLKLEMLYAYVTNEARRLEAVRKGKRDG